MDGVFAAASKNRPCIAQVGEGFCIPRRVLVLVPLLAVVRVGAGLRLVFLTEC